MSREKIDLTLNSTIAKYAAIAYLHDTPIVAEEITFPTPTGLSTCNMAIYELEQYAQILFIVNNNGEGMSITNAAEQLINYIRDIRLANFQDKSLIFAERYPGTPFTRLDIVIPTTEDDKCISVDWKPFDKVLEHYSDKKYA